jgi:hypothetical protein
MNNTFEFRDVSSEELQTVEGGFLGRAIAWVRSKFEDSVKDLEAEDRMGNFEIQDL